MLSAEDRDPNTQDRVVSWNPDEKGADSFEGQIGRELPPALHPPRKGRIGQGRHWFEDRVQTLPEPPLPKPWRPAATTPETRFFRHR